MTRSEHTPHTPWIREAEPWAPEPTPTGRAILRMWIEEQLRLVAAARERRATSNWRRRSVRDGATTSRQVKHRRRTQRRSGGGGAGAVPSRNHSLPSPPAK